MSDALDSLPDLPPPIEKTVTVLIDCPIPVVPRYDHWFMGAYTGEPVAGSIEPIAEGMARWRYEARVTCPQIVYHPPAVQVLPEPAISVALALGIVLGGLLVTLSRR